MKDFDVQGIDLRVPASRAFAFIADPAQLPRWTNARRAAALYRSHPAAEPSDTFVAWLRKVIVEKPDVQA